MIVYSSVRNLHFIDMFHHYNVHLLHYYICDVVMNVHILQGTEYDHIRPYMTYMNEVGIGNTSVLTIYHFSVMYYTILVSGALYITPYRDMSSFPIENI